MPRLEVELVPRTCWWSNVRSNVSKADWEKCKAFVKRRSGGCCEICGGKGRRHAVECHEVWHYDDETNVQTLVNLIALCPRCHEVKHIGRAQITGNYGRALEHLARVNSWPLHHAQWYVDTAMELWAIRSQDKWTLDVSFLSLLGIPVPERVDREAS